MSLFLSTYINKVDKKGRVSVPASFRSVVKTQEFIGVVVYQSFVNNCIEACSIERIISLSQAIEQMDIFSESKDAFAMSLLGESLQLGFDPDGRIILPDYMLDKVGIKDKAAFVGKGQVFEIWEPEQLILYKNKAREIAIKCRNELYLNRGNKK